MKYPANTIDHYINNVKEEMPVSKVLLFGSFAYGKPTKHSDVDLVVISPNFSKMDFDERLYFLQKKRDSQAFDIAMDIIGYTPKEFRDIEKHSAIMAYAKKHGKLIYPKRKRNRKKIL